MRYAFNNSLTWSEEIARYAFVWFVYTSAAYAVRYQRHVKFSFLVNILKKLSPISSGVLKLIALLLWISFMIFLDIYSIRLVITQFNLGQVSPSNQIPMYIIYIGVPLGSFLMTFRIAQHIFGEIKTIKASFTKKTNTGGDL